MILLIKNFTYISKQKYMCNVTFINVISEVVISKVVISIVIVSHSLVR
jgi:hypothetical protein